MAKSISRIPKEEVLEFVIREILGKRSVDSQEELASIINKRFLASGMGFRVSPERARLAAIKAGSRVTTVIKKGEMPSSCPACGRRLEKKYTKNLKGKNVVVALKCQKCGYFGKEGNWLACKYTFSRI